MPEAKPEEYQLRYFKEHGYERRKCRVGGDYFWTLNPTFDTCQDVPDVDYWFDKIPSVPGLTVREARRKFIEFFAKRGHEPLPPRPVVARWREDLYLTIASIVDFQPHVTSGLVPPPANPLVISQPCIRLEDIDNVGLTIGRHLTTFEMAAHHAFNYPDKYVYWKDETVAYAYEFFTKEIGIPGDLIVFKESWWEGGGNAGPSFEVTVGGLELATLVFMQYKVVDGNYVELPLKIVDTGYGVERIAWFTQKTPTAFQAIYGDVLGWARQKLGLEEPPKEVLWAAFRASGSLNPDEPASVNAYYERVAAIAGMPLADVRRTLETEARLYSVLDHTKTLAMMLGDGVVPSNSGEGYLARLVLRRAYRQLRGLSPDVSLVDFVERQIQLWGDDFPQLKDNRDYILDAVGLEEQRYRDLLTRADRMVAKQLTGNLDVEALVKLYDSYGIPPEVIAEIAKKKGLSITIPHNFYSIVAARHRAPKKVRELEQTSNLPREVVEWASRFQPTQLLFHRDPYLRSFNARLLGALGEYFVLDSTAFYATGGGQINDTGFVNICGEDYKVVDVQKVGQVIVHKADRPVKATCEEVRGEIDWARRFRLMRHHTATHVVLAAARKVLGSHVWQAGAEKTPEKARLDITHHRPLTDDDIKRIEEVANSIVDQHIPVIQSYMDRNEAEKKYGFSLYEGGVPMEPKIRVVEIPGYDAEACFGTHVTNTSEVGAIKIINVEKLQDGVIRLEFVAGTRVAEELSKRDELLSKLASEAGVERGNELAGVKELKEELGRASAAVRAYRAMWLEDTIRELKAAEAVGKVKLAVVEFPESDVKAAREVLRKLTDAEPASVVALAIKLGDGYQYEVGLGSEAAKLLEVSQLLEAVRKELRSTGGGRGTYASFRSSAAPTQVREVLERALRASGNK